MENYEHIRDLWRSVHQDFERHHNNIATEQKRRANEWLDRHRDLLAVAERTDGYEAFVLAYIQREQARYRGRPARGDEIGRRDRPLCTCEPSNCPLKRGRLPREIKAADSVDQGITDFRTRSHHEGDPTVLSEAQDAYSEIMTAVGQILREAETILTSEAEPPADRVTVSAETMDALSSTRAIEAVSQDEEVAEA